MGRSAVVDLNFGAFAKSVASVPDEGGVVAKLDPCAVQALGPEGLRCGWDAGDRLEFAFQL